jgi:hypothetical protein
MRNGGKIGVALAATSVAVLFAACSADDRAFGLSGIRPGGSSYSSSASNDGGPFEFEPLATSAACTVGGNAAQPFVLPAGFTQSNVASEPDYADVPDMITQNESGVDKGRYLYQVHEVGSNGSLSVTDLATGVTKTIARRSDWESLDPVRWTPWGTLLIGEETNAAGFRDPQFPQSVGGLVYELVPNGDDPTTIDAVFARPAIGAKSHEGMIFDGYGNLYSISERTPGYIFKFVLDRRGDLSSGQTFVLKITEPTGDRTGSAEWVPLDRQAVQLDASAAGDAVQATGYGRPEDVELATSRGADRDGENTLYVAITSEHRIIAIDLAPGGRNDDARDDGVRGVDRTGAFVYDYVRRGLNTTTDFEMPDNLAFDHQGNLFITEDPGGSFSSGKRRGDDIWVATPGKGKHTPAASVLRFASLTDCDAEPTGLLFEMHRNVLFVHAQHRGGDRLDKTVAIQRASKD